MRPIYWRCFVLFVVGGGRAGVFQLPLHTAHMEEASLSGFVTGIGPEGVVAVTHADSSLCGFCLEQRKPTFEASERL